MKVAIVGGGSVGLSLAYEIFRYGNQVSIFEASEKLGGVLRDKVTQDSIFFNGCQYLNPAAKSYRDFPRKNLLEFTHNYGSYTDIFSGEHISHDFAGPTVSIRLNIPSVEKSQLAFTSVSEKLELYPDIINEGLTSWLHSLGLDSKMLHKNSLEAFNAERIMLDRQIEEVRDLRLDYPYMSDLYSLPHFNLPKGKQIASIPIHGYDRYIDREIGHSLPAKVFYKSKISVKSEDRNVQLIHNGEPIVGYEKIIWTSNPNPLFRKLTSEKLDSLGLDFQVVVGYCDFNVSQPFYIQVYSKNTKVFRVYVYQLDGRSKFSIEQKFEGDRPETIQSNMEFATDVLRRFGFFGKLHPVASFRSKRYDLFSSKDYNLLDDFSQTLKDSNIVSGSWTKYGRDLKMNSILKSVFASK